MKVAILLSGFDKWGGGIDLVRNLCSSLDDTDENLDLNLILLDKDNLPLEIVKSGLKNVLNDLGIKKKSNNEKLKTTYLQEQFEGLKSIQIITIKGTFKHLKKYLIREKYDIIFPSFYTLGKNFEAKWIGYIYDFQHKYLPNFFTRKEIRERDKNFQIILEHATDVFVYSQAVANDILKFHSSSKARIHILPYCPIPKDEWLIDDRNLKKTYNISKPYFIICNQFWIHKDHTTALKAFFEFKKLNGSTHQLVLTGKTTDYRFPEYFRDLENLIYNLDIKEDVKILGHIPKLDQIALLKNSVCAIQPTLFEGGPGGGIAYEALALDVPIILSKIDVNLELENIANLEYFEPQNQLELARKMSEMTKKSFQKKSNEEIRQLGKKRSTYLKNSILELLNTVSDK